MEAAAPGVALAAEEGLHLAPVLGPPNPPGPDPDLLAPVAARAPTRGPGVCTLLERSHDANEIIRAGY